MEEGLKILAVIFTSCLKFLGGPFLAYKLNTGDIHFSYMETVLYSITGGMLGVFVFTYFGEQVTKFWHWIRKESKEVFIKKEVFSEPRVDVEEQVQVHYLYVEKNAQPVKKKFTPRNRRIIKIWRAYGLMGIAVLTPIISIPVGTIIANNMVQNKKKIFLYMFVSIVFWSFVITLLAKSIHGTLL